MKTKKGILSDGWKREKEKLQKLASSGHHPAGITYEIKNPLNFVNNFSDLSIELVEEVRKELSAFRGRG